MAIAHPAVLQPELLITTWVTDVQNEALPNDVFDKLSAPYINETQKEAKEIPNAIYLKLQASADEGRYTVVSMVKDLSAAPTLGAAGNQVGAEEDITTKDFRMEFTDLSHATTNQAYGIYARDKFPYKLFEQRVPLLGRYFKQYFGKMRRMALTEIQSENLETAPHFLPANLSPNWYVPNRTNAQQPVYTIPLVDWVDTIAASLTAAGTGINACCAVTYLQRLEEYARTWKLITTIDFADGSDGYVVILPTPQCRWLKHCIQLGNLGYMYKEFDDLSNDLQMQFPGCIGKVGGLMIYEDARYATLTLTGASGQSGYLTDSQASYGITIQYRAMGNADDGSSDPRDKSATARQLGWLLGKGALCEWMPEGFHWEWEYEQYDKFFGSGIFCSVGIKQPQFDVHAGDATTLQQNGSIVLPFAQPPELNNYTSLTA
jgi:hypothetical protein